MKKRYFFLTTALRRLFGRDALLRVPDLVPQLSNPTAFQKFSHPANFSPKKLGTCGSLSLPVLWMGALLLMAVPHAPAADNSGVPLFNGRDLSGWTVKAKPADVAKGFWTVTNGVIVADSLRDGDHDYVWLVSNREYTNFTLRLQFQAFTNSPGNSGIQVRSRYDDTAYWLDGPQIDINPPDPWRTGMMWDETRGNQGWLFPALPKGQWVKPDQALPGMKFYFSHEQTNWNDFEITAQGTRITALLNGVKVTDYDGKGILNDENHQKKRVGMSGHLALQIHIKDKLRIKYRNIRIVELE
jgi:hypothetical protein